MTDKVADLHIHSKFSDADKDHLEIADIMCTDQYNDISTIAKTDHDTLLGTEELIDALKERRPGTRVIAGTELTTMCDLPVVGNYTMHTLLYFYTTDGFDLMAFSQQDQDALFRTIAENYLEPINSCIKANNHRRLTQTRVNCNNFFFKGNDTITEDAVKEHANARLASIVSPTSLINLDNSVVAVLDTDMMELVVKNGIGNEPSDLRPHFQRDGEIYVRLSENEYTVRFEDMLAELGEISRNCPVKVKRGFAHPSTYVRAIARKLVNDAELSRKHVYDRDIVTKATLDVTEMIMDLKAERLMDFIESDYPRYSLVLPKSKDVESIEVYYGLAKKELEFSRCQKTYWRLLACKLDMPISGGSDSHFNRMTPEIARGFGDLQFPDRLVEKIFYR